MFFWGFKLFFESSEATFRYPLSTFDFFKEVLKPKLSQLYRYLSFGCQLLSFRFIWYILNKWHSFEEAQTSAATAVSVSNFSCHLLSFFFSLATKLTVANFLHMDKFQTTVFSCWGFCSRGCSCSCCCCTVGRGLILSTLDIWQVLREAEPFAMFALRCALPTTNVTPSPWSTIVWKTTKIFYKSHRI